MEKISPSWLAWPETSALLRAFGGMPVRFVGGCVRDALLAIEAKDVDLATPLVPEKVIQTLKQADIKAIPTGIYHGTVTAVIDKRHFEITTLRRDVTTDGRRATVAYTDDWKEDAARRDFTMNALYCDASGQLFDYFCGYDDALAGRVRFIGDAKERISEDALRILRFFRFFARYSKDTINIEALSACGALAGKLDALSGERISAEMMKLLVAPKAADVVVMMQQYNVWKHVVPQRVGVESLRRLPDVLAKADMAPQPILALALLLRSREEGDIASVIKTMDERWKLSKAQFKELQALCNDIGDIGNEKVQKKKIRAFGKELFIRHVILLMAEGENEAQSLKAIELARDWEVPIFPVTGDDLLSRGIAPGREMGALLVRLEGHWEEGGYTATKEELLARA